ncbi:transferase [Clostridium perfringens]|nr:transferase [Clostridium perfringens]
MKDIIIIGAGGVGKEVAFIIEQINIKTPIWNILGIVDDNKSLWRTEINGYKVLGGLSVLEKFKNQDIKPYIVIAIANYKIKKAVIEKLKGRFKFATIIHPNVFIHDSVKIGEGTVIYPTVIMTTNITLGNHVIVSPKCGIGHDSIIKDYVSLLWNVNVSGHDIIEEGVLMGSGSTVIQGKVIGEGAIVGAGAVVVNDIDKYTTNVGIPTRIVNN